MASTFFHWLPAQSYIKNMNDFFFTFSNRFMILWWLFDYILLLYYSCFSLYSILLFHACSFIYLVLKLELYLTSVDPSFPARKESLTVIFMPLPSALPYTKM